jgi:hypothetical protein
MAHVRKRQFQPSSQPSIKSFFTTVGTSSAASSADIDDEYARPLKPTVPDHVQSLLINVGMRVRKSVPEGYKTHKSLPVPRIEYMHPGSIPQNHSDLPTSSAPELYSKPSELAPFCGLHKIGGFSSQPTSSAPGLSYSQSTVASSVSTPQTPQTNTRKRNYAEDMDAELDTFFDDQHDSMLDDTTSPKPKYPLSHSSMPDLSAKSSIVSPQSRPKARMKARSPHKLVQDFSDEDVGFLQPMDCE